MAKQMLSFLNSLIPRHHGGNKVTGFLLLMSLTVNAYLLLQIRMKPDQIKNRVTLDQKNKAFLRKLGVPRADVKEPGNYIAFKSEIDSVNKGVGFEIKNGKGETKNDLKQPIQEINPKSLFCSDHSKWTNHLINPETDTNLTDWSFKSRRQCPKFSVDEYPKIRHKVTLFCDGKNSKILTSDTKSTRDIEQVEFGNECLRDVIDNCCRGKHVVPNVVHYVWYADKELGYFHFISFMSALRFMKPCLVLIHGPFIPRGKYWNYFVSISPNVIHVKREKPTEIFGQKLAYPEHASDIMRIEALKAYGGVYLDFDEIILRSLEPLRKYDYTQGYELNVALGSQFLMARRNATFLTLWYLSYRDDYKNLWAWNALWVPAKLSKIHPELIHIDGYNFTRPNGKHVDLIYKHNYDWSTNYGMHMYVRWYKNVTNNVIIRTLNTTIGAVCRHILFGNKELCVQ